MLRLVKRKWGHYLVLLSRKHFKVKLLRFNHRSSLSMQKHRLRNELWLILKGIGQFNSDDNTSFEVGAGAYIHIIKNTWHQMVVRKPVWILEIQYGDRCDEEDIIRA